MEPRGKMWSKHLREEQGEVEMMERERKEQEKILINVVHRLDRIGDWFRTLQL